MILKSYEIKKMDLSKYKLILFHGKNEGLKTEIINKLIPEEKTNYGVEEILNNKEHFIENLLSHSLFDEKKVIIIKRANDKLFNFINEIINKQIGNTIIIIDSDGLETRSKLRLLFEKSKKFISVAFYPDNEDTLSKIAHNFFKEKKISISYENINQIVNKSRGDRHALLNELLKIESFSKNGKKINTENLEKLINLSENYSILELVDNCMAKNKKKIMNILNENNFTNEDSVIISRFLLNKSKKILKLVNEFEKNKNIELTISKAKPPIFWKDKEITKKQILKWSPQKIRELIYKISEVELNIKNNINNSVYIITDFVIEQASSQTNN